MERKDPIAPSAAAAELTRHRSSLSFLTIPAEPPGERPPVSPTGSARSSVHSEHSGGGKNATRNGGGSRTRSLLSLFRRGSKEGGAGASPDPPVASLGLFGRRRPRAASTSVSDAVATPDAGRRGGGGGRSRRGSLVGKGANVTEPHHQQHLPPLDGSAMASFADWTKTDSFLDEPAAGARGAFRTPNERVLQEQQQQWELQQQRLHRPSRLAAAMAVGSESPAVDPQAASQQQQQQSQRRRPHSASSVASPAAAAAAGKHIHFANGTKEQSSSSSASSAAAVYRSASVPHHHHHYHQQQQQQHHHHHAGKGKGLYAYQYSSLPVLTEHRSISDMAAPGIGSYGDANQLSVKAGPMSAALAAAAAASAAASEQQQQQQQQGPDIFENNYLPLLSARTSAASSVVNLGGGARRGSVVSTSSEKSDKSERALAQHRSRGLLNMLKKRGSKSREDLGGNGNTGPDEWGEPELQGSTDAATSEQPQSPTRGADAQSPRATRKLGRRFQQQQQQSQREAASTSGSGVDPFGQATHLPPGASSTTTTTTDRAELLGQRLELTADDPATFLIEGTDESMPVSAENALAATASVLPPTEVVKDEKLPSTSTLASAETPLPQTPAAELPAFRWSLLAGSQQTDWKPPESWGVALDDYDSLDDDGRAPPAPLPLSLSSHDQHLHEMMSGAMWRAGGGVSGPGSPQNASPEAATLLQERAGEPEDQNIRIFFRDGRSAIIRCRAHASAREVCGALVRQHGIGAPNWSLYVRRWAKERALGASELPLQLQQMFFREIGYAYPDDMLGRIPAADQSYLFRFIFSEQLPPSLSSEAIARKYFVQQQQQGDGNTGPRRIDLSAADINALPVGLFRVAGTLEELSLAQNPMLELPLDFCQLCVSLRRLSLQRNWLTRLPASIAQLAALEELDVSRNSLRELPASESLWRSLACLRVLNVSKNRLMTLPPQLRECRALADLDASNNELGEVPAVVWRELLPRLVRLECGYNHILVFPELFEGGGDNATLRVLGLCGNRLQRLPSLARRTFLALEQLDVRFNRITESEAFLRACPASLRRVYLQGNPHTETLPVPPAGSRLEELHLEGVRLGRLELPRKEEEEEGRISDLQEATPRESPALPLQPQQRTWLREMDLTGCGLSSLPGGLGGALRGSLEVLRLDRNRLTGLPQDLGALRLLRVLTVSCNYLTVLPASLRELGALQSLDLHCNCLNVLPGTVWELGALVSLNASSNQIFNVVIGGSGDDGGVAGRSGSGSGPARLRELSLASNALGNVSAWLGRPFFRALVRLNLSCNYITDIEPGIALEMLEEMYLSGNDFSTLPFEDALELMPRLRVVHVNANPKLSTLPAELAKCTLLEDLDASFCNLRYNVWNWPYDWNWMWSPRLRSLDLSANGRLEISAASEAQLDSFLGLRALRFLNLAGTRLKLSELRTRPLREAALDSLYRPQRIPSLTLPDGFGFSSHHCGFLWELGIGEWVRADAAMEQVLLREEFASRNDFRESLFGVFQGEGGFTVAKWMRDHTAPVLENQLRIASKELADLEHDDDDEDDNKENKEAADAARRQARKEKAQLALRRSFLEMARVLGMSTWGESQISWDLVGVLGVVDKLHMDGDLLLRELLEYWAEHEAELALSVEPEKEEEEGDVVRGFLVFLDETPAERIEFFPLVIEWLEGGGVLTHEEVVRHSKLIIFALEKLKVLKAWGLLRVFARRYRRILLDYRRISLGAARKTAGAAGNEESGLLVDGGGGSSGGGTGEDAHLVGDAGEDGATALDAPLVSFGPAEACSAAVVYIDHNFLHVASLGDVRAILSREGEAVPLCNTHTQINGAETHRIRHTGGFLSVADGRICGEARLTRAMGQFHLLPHVTQNPDLHFRELREGDSVLVVGNSSLWRVMSATQAMDIARAELAAAKPDWPAVAAQRIRDRALAYFSAECPANLGTSIRDHGGEKAQPVVVQKENQLLVLVVNLENYWRRTTAKPHVYEEEERREEKAELSATHSGRGASPSASRYKARPRRHPDAFTAQELALLADPALPNAVERDAEAPVGRIAIVFTDIKNSSGLWEALGSSMVHSMKLHNALMRRLLKLLGGFEVKTEGDALMAAFDCAVDAMRWCVLVQLELLDADWNAELLSHRHAKARFAEEHLLALEDEGGSAEAAESRKLASDTLTRGAGPASPVGARTYNSLELAMQHEHDQQQQSSLESGSTGRARARRQLIYRGFSVRMGIHVGEPICTVDEKTGRMDYLGPIVNRAARVSSAADGGQIVVSQDFLDMFRAEDGERRVRNFALEYCDLGARALKGLEEKSNLYMVVPRQLSGRKWLGSAGETFDDGIGGHH